MVIVIVSVIDLDMKVHRLIEQQEFITSISSKKKSLFFGATLVLMLHISHYIYFSIYVLTQDIKTCILLSF